VLNVPGADLVDMFHDSTGSGRRSRASSPAGNRGRQLRAERFLDVARWFVDAVDPQNLGARTGARDLFLQMATLDFIIPNTYTEALEAATGAPRRDYVAEHGFLVIPVEPEYLRGPPTREVPQRGDRSMTRALLIVVMLAASPTRRGSRSASRRRRRRHRGARRATTSRRAWTNPPPSPTAAAGGSASA